MPFVIDDGAGGFTPIGSRSGNYEPFSHDALQADSAAQAASSAPSSSSGFSGSAPVTATEQVVRSEINVPQFVVYLGVRDDAPYLGGFGPRVRVGLLTDATFGVERWLQNGTRQLPTWS